MENQFEKNSLKKTHTKNMSVEKKIIIWRDFTPFRRNKCNKHNRRSMPNKYSKAAFHLKFSSSYSDVP